jgi:two-component system LytT family response regulator
MHLTVYVTEGEYKLNQDEIIYLEAHSNYTKFYLTGKRKIFSAKTLKRYEELLPLEFFIRVHSSYLVNVLHICKLNTVGKISLTQNFSVPISRRKKRIFKDLIIRKLNTVA